MHVAHRAPSPHGRHPIRRTPCLARLGVLAVVVLAVSGTACSDDDGPSATTAVGDDARPTIAVTTSILGDVVSNVVGDLAVVEVIMPAGADPHTFEASARQAVALRDADLVVTIGLDLESGMHGTLESVADEGTPVFAIGPELSPIPFGDNTGDNTGDTGDTDNADHDHVGGLDPHVWMDPDRMSSAAMLLADRIALETGLDGQALRRNAEQFAATLAEADERVQAALARVPEDRRTLVTNHEALGYFADRYGFTVVATIIPGGSTDAEPSAAHITELTEILRREGVPAVFAENVDDTRLAEMLADEVGTVEVVELTTDALGGPGSGAETYAELLVANAEAIADALAP